VEPAPESADEPGQPGTPGGSPPGRPDHWPAISRPRRRELNVYFVGSGSVEAECKAVVAQRLKLSDMHWSVRGATGIATLRCQEASGRSKEH